MVAGGRASAEVLKHRGLGRAGQAWHSLSEVDFFSTSVDDSADWDLLGRRARLRGRGRACLGTAVVVSAHPGMP